MRAAIVAITLSLGLLVSGSASAKAAQCKDAHGKFTKCPPAAAAATTPTPPPAKPPGAGPCKDAKGKFIKCTAATTSTTTTTRTPTTTTTTSTVRSSVSHTSAIPTGPVMGAPSGATAKCKDGSYSMSKTHSGSCSHHGGVAQWL